MLICEEDQKKIDAWVGKFPSGKQSSALLMALKIVQDRHGYLFDELLDAVAQYLSLPQAQVYEVASFYSMYRRQMCGEQDIKVCTSLSCCLKGAGAVIQYIEKKLGIALGGVTKDQKFSLNEAECLGACQNAPVVIINDQHYHHQVTPQSIDQLLDGCKHEQE